ncbi:sulfotransferase 1A1-like isoform X1 [Haliotis rubra]|uniref:sulfotransferase 1A1-like isoform X1 n=1 Tax=Haliotis rubra TaxID=36100 RepID=UPI001EE53590|nr:sulfotransferase 1A1-like isoform X1 [Haliotis rubra]
MNIKVETDKFGKTIKYMMFNGRHHFPAYPPSVLDQIKSVSMRPDDVFCPAFPRTGTHWTFEMVGMLLNGTADTIPTYKEKIQLEFTKNDELSSLPSRRIINTHFQLSRAPTQLREKKCKIIYNLRDPKDVAVSLYCLYMDIGVTGYQGTFKDFLELFDNEKVECNRRSPAPYRS